MNRRIAVRAIILDGQGKVFCVRLKDRQTKQPLDYWCLPGGGLDPGEPVVDGLHREMIEETAIAPQIGALLYIQQYRKDETQEEMEFFFHVTNAADYETIDLAATSHGEDEIIEYGFVDPKQVYVLPKLLATEDLAAQAKTAQPPKIFNYLPSKNDQALSG